MLVIAGAASLLTACAPNVSESLAGDLAKDAKPLLDSGCKDPTRWVDPEQLPASFKQLQPERVAISKQGLNVTTRTFFVLAWGVFIPCDPRSFRPVPGGDPGYEPVGHDVYTYHIAG
jgi:hypothetical protein